MTGNTPSNEEMRKKGGVIDQRQQQIDPTGKRRYDPNDSAIPRSQKQAGQDLSEPQSGQPVGDGRTLDRQKHSDPGRREDGQSDHAGTGHSPRAADTLTPGKQGGGGVRPPRPPKTP